MQLATEEQLVRDASSAFTSAETQSGAILRTPEELANIVSLFASSDGWMNKVRLRAEGRWYERLYHGPDYDIWVISWLPGQSTAFTITVRLRELFLSRPGFWRSIALASRLA